MNVKLQLFGSINFKPNWKQQNKGAKIPGDRSPESREFELLGNFGEGENLREGVTHIQKLDSREKQIPLGSPSLEEAQNPKNQNAGSEDGEEDEVEG